MSKITQYAELVAVDAGDVLPVVDLSDVSMAATGTTKKVAVGNLPGGGVTVTVPKPSGTAATDTANIQAAVSKLVTALGSGPAALLFQDGTYVIDSNAAVIEDVADFTVRGSGGTVIAQAANRAGNVNNTAGDLFVISGCTDFRVEGITFDGRRDTISPPTPAAAAIASGQPSVTVAAGLGSRFLAGQVVHLYGGHDTAEKAQAQSLTVSTVTPGGGAGGGDLVTFTGSITATYNILSAGVLSDAFGPYGSAGAYLTFYSSPGVTNMVAGLDLSGEDQQNGLHLIGCQRFTVRGVTARNVWQSPVKLGCGVNAQAGNLATGCSDGVVTGCQSYHGYDQGVSVWLSKNITVTGCDIDSTGWGGVVLTMSDLCTVTGNTIRNVIYGSAATAGGGVVVEGGVRNTITGNVITCPVTTTAWAGISIQGWPSNGRFGLSATNTAWPTLTAYTVQGTAAGTQVALSATAGLMAGGRYSLFDGYRTEAVTVATIGDGTHVTFTETTRFSHAAGLYLSPRISEENTATGNVIDLAGAATGANGFFCHGSVRNLIASNTVKNWTNTGIQLDQNAGYCPPSSYIGGDGSQVIGNTLAGGNNQPILLSGVSRMVVKGNQIHGVPTTGNNRGIALNGVTDSVIEGNSVTDINVTDGIRLTQGGPANVYCARVAVTGNVIRRAVGNGISVVGADSCQISGNLAVSCGGWGISLTGVSNCQVHGNTCNSCKSGGITLGNNASTGCTGCRVTGNTCREDGTGVNASSGATFTQPHGITETGASDANLFTGNACDSNTTDQLVTTGAGSLAWANILSGAMASPPLLNAAAFDAAGTGAAAGAAAAAASLPLAGGTLAGPLAMGTSKITGLGNGTASTDAAAFGQIPLIDGTAADIKPAGAQAAGASGKAADGSHVHPAGSWAPADMGLIAANMPDPMTGATSGAATAGTVYLSKFLIRYGFTVTNICLLVATAGNNGSGSLGTFAGLYASDGSLMSGSSDVATLLTSTGLATLALTTPQPVTAGTFVWAAFVCNLGTTQPTLVKSGASISCLNGGLTAATFRVAVNGTSKTSLAAITPASNTATGAAAWFAGLS